MGGEELIDEEKLGAEPSPAASKRGTQIKSDLPLPCCSAF